MKKIFIIFLLVLSFAITAQEAQAANINGLLNKSASNAAKRQEILGNRLQKAKNHGTRLANRRIEALQRLLTRIQNDKKLSASDKTTLTNDIQNVITQIQALKTKIGQDTTLADVKADSKQIITKFRVFMVLIPKVRLLIVISNLQSLSTRLNDKVTNAQSLLDKAKANGKDVSSLQTSLNTIKTKLQEINTKLAEDKTTVLGVTPQSPNAHQTFVQVRQNLAKVRADFGSIRHLFAQLRADLHKLLKPTPTP